MLNTELTREVHEKLMKTATATSPVTWRTRRMTFCASCMLSLCCVCSGLLLHGERSSVVGVASKLSSRSNSRLFTWILCFFISFCTSIFRVVVFVVRWNFARRSDFSSFALSLNGAEATPGGAEAASGGVKATFRGAEATFQEGGGHFRADSYSCVVGWKAECLALRWWRWNAHARSVPSTLNFWLNRCLTYTPPWRLPKCVARLSLACARNQSHI